MNFSTKQEQYEWWTESIRRIQSHKESIRAGCRELGIPFWQYYDWKERVQHFVDIGEVKLSSHEAGYRPKGKTTTQVEGSFVEVVTSTPMYTDHLQLYFKDSWRLEIPDNVNPTALTTVLKVLESL